jgi:hypothetical protein
VLSGSAPIHHIALTERAYTMANARRYPSLLVALYLELPLAWKIMGKQFLVIAKK